MQAFMVFPCIGYECQTFHLKNGMPAAHTLSVVAPGRIPNLPKRFLYEALKHFTPSEVTCLLW